MFREVNLEGTGTRTAATHSSCLGDQRAPVGGVSSIPFNLVALYNYVITTKVCTKHRTAILSRFIGSYKTATIKMY